MNNERSFASAANNFDCRTDLVKNVRAVVAKGLFFDFFVIISTLERQNVEFWK